MQATKKVRPTVTDGLRNLTRRSSGARLRGRTQRERSRTRALPASEPPARFEAELGSSEQAKGTVFVSGSLNAYEIEDLRAKAMYGVTRLDIRLIGANLEHARLELDRQLAKLSLRGVDINVSHVVATSQTGPRALTRTLLR